MPQASTPAAGRRPSLGDRAAAHTAARRRSARVPDGDEPRSAGSSAVDARRHVGHRKLQRQQRHHACITAVSGRSTLPWRRNVPVSTDEQRHHRERCRGERGGQPAMRLDDRTCRRHGHSARLVSGWQQLRPATSRSRRGSARRRLVVRGQLDRVLREGQHVEPAGLAIHLLAGAVLQQHRGPFGTGSISRARARPGSWRGCSSAVHPRPGCRAASRPRRATGHRR